MKKKIQSLVRLLDYRQKMIDLKRLELLKLQSQHDALSHQQQELITQDLLEKAKLDQNSEGKYTLDSYLKESEKKQVNLENQKRNLVPLIEAMQDELRAMFEDLKVVEISKESHQEILEQEVSRKEQRFLDDLAAKKRRALES